jgi:hypothetical protein
MMKDGVGNDLRWRLKDLAEQVRHAYEGEEAQRFMRGRAEVKPGAPSASVWSWTRPNCTRSARTPYVTARATRFSRVGAAGSRSPTARYHR